METSPIQYAVVRPEKPYKDPDTGEILGYEALYVGTSELKRTGDPAKLLLTSTDMESDHRGSPDQGTAG